MKFFFSVVLCFFLLAACGEKVEHTPEISNLSFAPESALVGEYGGYVNVEFVFQYFDSGSDVKEVAFLQSVSGNPLSTESFDPLASLTEGQVNFHALMETSEARTIDFEIYVTDSEGNRSNSLTGAFIINSSS